MTIDHDSAADLEAVRRGARDGAHPLDHDGSELRSAADRVWWRWWQREAKRRHGAWLPDGFGEATASAWDAARRASRDDPQLAASRYAEAVLRRIAPTRPEPR